MPGVKLALGYSAMAATVAVIVGLGLSQEASIVVLFALCGVFVLIDRTGGGR